MLVAKTFNGVIDIGEQALELLRYALCVRRSGGRVLVFSRVRPPGWIPDCRCCSPALYMCD